MEKIAYSYHTFYFPFVWNSKKMKTMQQYIHCLKQQNKWEDISVHSFEEADPLKVADYQTLQFFTLAARKSLFGWDENFVRCFQYVGAHNATYFIEKTEEINDNKTITRTYKLTLDGIKLKIYNTGIGVLTFEVENYTYCSLEDVKRINEYGRRIFAPYFGSKGICGCCADQLGIIINGETIKTPVSRLQPQTESQCIPDFIRYILPDTKIIPAIDDRMFVACVVVDVDVFRQHMVYQRDADVAKSLYEFCYIDLPNSCSCPTEAMRSELLDRSIYKRWIEYTDNQKAAGSIYAATHHSMVCLTATTDPLYPFLTIYTHMISVVLAQRAAIIAFDANVSATSKGFEKKFNMWNICRIKQLKKLQEKHIAFLNQHMNIEVTNQEQGIEIYRLLQQEMYIAEEREMLEKEVEFLSGIADTANDLLLGGIGLWIAIIQFLYPLLYPMLSSLYQWAIGLFSV